MLNLHLMYSELLSAIMRLITGRFLTEEQIKSITSNAVGKYFTDLFPTPEEELKAQERVEAARKHISSAGTIIRDMQHDLETQDQKLVNLLEQVKEKKELAERYQILAETNQKEFQAFRQEMEDALRHELMEQAQKGKRLRQVASLTIWIITLLLGAVLGTYFKDIVAWSKLALANKSIQIKR